jgi:hypothetical protein
MLLLAPTAFVQVDSSLKMPQWTINIEGGVKRKGLLMGMPDRFPAERKYGAKAAKMIAINLVTVLEGVLYLKARPRLGIPRTAADEDSSFRYGVRLRPTTPFGC